MTNNARVETLRRYSGIANVRVVVDAVGATAHERHVDAVEKITARVVAALGNCGVVASVADLTAPATPDGTNGPKVTLTETVEKQA